MPPSTTSGMVHRRRSEQRGFAFVDVVLLPDGRGGLGQVGDVARPALDLPSPLVEVVEKDREVQREEPDRQHDCGDDAGIGEAMMPLLQCVPRSSHVERQQQAWRIMLMVILPRVNGFDRYFSTEVGRYVSIRSVMVFAMARSRPTSGDAVRRRPKDRKAQIARASAEAFSTLGFYGVSMEAIASRVGISAAALYRHYSSKYELFRDAVLSLGQQLVDCTAFADDAAPTTRS